MAWNPECPHSANAQTSTKSASGRAPSINSLIMELCKEKQFTSKGAGEYTEYYLGNVLSGMGPQLEDIVAHSYGRGFSANFKYKVTAEKSYDGLVWSSFASALIGEQTNTGYVISSAYTTRTDFGLYIRFKVEVSDTAASKEIGVLSVSIALRFAP